MLPRYNSLFLHGDDRLPDIEMVVEIGEDRKHLSSEPGTGTCPLPGTTAGTGALTPQL